MYDDPNHFFASPAGQLLAQSKRCLRPGAVPCVRACDIVTLNCLMHNVDIRLYTSKALLITLREDVLYCNVYYEGIVMQTLF